MKDEIGFMDQRNYGLMPRATSSHPLSCFTAMLASAVDVKVTFPAPGCSFTLLTHGRNENLEDIPRQHVKVKPIIKADLCLRAAWTRLYVDVTYFMNVCMYVCTAPFSGASAQGLAIGSSELRTGRKLEGFRSCEAESVRCLAGFGLWTKSQIRLGRALI